MIFAGDLLNANRCYRAVRGQCRDRVDSEPCAREFSRDFICLPLLKKGTPFVRPKPQPLCEDFSGPGFPPPFKKYSKSPQFTGHRGPLRR